MPAKRTLFTCLFLLFFIPVVSAQQKYPATLLWRISGKGLSSPSYLYGTMHVQDRRLFYFGDSLYNAIEKTQSFAMEVNPDEMMDSLFKSLEKSDTTPLLKMILNEREYNRVAKQLEKKLKIPADKITLKKLGEARRNQVYKYKRNDDMPTPMDMYLFTIARRQGKYTCGIEDVADQMDVLDEIGALHIDDLIKDDTLQQINYLEQMKKMYIDRDLTRLNEMVNGKFTDTYKDILLIKRNVKMALRIDSLAHLRNGFFAIGAAHLPGDSGVINLLQQRGFTVEPVMSSAYLAPEDYKYTAKEIEWHKVEDGNKLYSVQMPGVPSDLLSANVLPMKMYVDLSDLSYYGVGVTPVAEEEAKSDSFFIKIMNNYKKTGFVIEDSKAITYKGLKGIEMYAVQNSENHFRYRILVKANQMFIIIFGGAKKENLAGANAEKYLNSLEFGNENDFISIKKNWQDFASASNAFKMRVPGKPKLGKEDEGDGIMTDKYETVDFTDGSYYSVTVTDTKPGFYIENDSVNFQEYRKNLDRSTKGGVKEFSIEQFKNYAACHFVAVQKEGKTDYVLQGYMVRRGNRTYLPLVVSLKEKADFPEFTNFFRSFEFTPFNQEGWQTHAVANSPLSLFAPAAFKKIVKDSTQDDKDRFTKYLAQDKHSGITYSVEVEPLSPYYWSKSDTAFFKMHRDGFMSYGDSLVSYTYNNGPVKSADVLIKLPAAPLYKKLKLFLDGDTLYTLYSYQPKEILDNTYFSRFFSEADFTHTYPATIFKNKAAALLQALQTKDSTTFAAVSTVFYSAVFSKDDLPLLYAALSKKYYEDKNTYRIINSEMANKIIELGDSSVIDFVAGQYPVKNDSTADVQMELLKLLANYKTAASYRLLKNLLLHSPPVKGSVYNIIYRITDSMQLAKVFFPDATQLYGDTIVGAGIIKMANQLVDSGMVTATDVLKNEKGIYALAGKQLAEFRKDKEAYPDYNEEVIKMLGRLNTKEGNALLNQFAKQTALAVKQDAVIALLKNNQPVAATDIRKFAADKEWRTVFYEALKKIGKSNLFPKEFYNQQKFAEGYLYANLSDDGDVAIKSIQLIKSKTAVLNGKLKQFYIYKVVLDEEDDIPHVAFCGAFDNNLSVAELGEADIDVYCDYDQPFSQDTIDEKFKMYIDKKNSGDKSSVVK